MAPNSVTFKWYDYTMFATVFAVSCLTGIYFGCFGKGQTNTRNYLLGGKNMKYLPIAFSVAASHFSGITILGVTANVYKYGSSSWLMGLSFVIVGFLAVYVYLPVFFNSQFISVYEYLEKRFDRKTRTLCSCMYIFCEIFGFSVLVYTPCLVLYTATGFSINVAATVMCGICVFYTTIGGIRTVVWTDIFQLGVIMVSFLAALIIGLSASGGIISVFEAASSGERLQIFDFNPDPHNRGSFWIFVFGFSMEMLSLVAIHQSGVQKFLALPSYTSAVYSVVYTVISMCFVYTFITLIGLVVYSFYENCDPFTTREITKHDQLLPYFIGDISRKAPGIFGIFMAAIFSAALSSMSSNLNALSGVIYKDFVSLYVTSEKYSGEILKLIMVLTGVLCTSFVLVVKHLGELMSMISLLLGLTNGPLLGVFTLGILFPKGNAKGAFYGTLCGCIVSASLIISAKYYQIKGKLTYPTKPLSASNCEAFYNITQFVNITSENKSQPPSIVMISFHYYTIIAAVITLFFGLVISYSTKDVAITDKNLISPAAQFLLPERCQNGGPSESVGL